MKKITLLVASIFLLGGSIEKKKKKIVFSVERKSPADFINAEPIVFTERGIEFFIFPDGQLDFNTHPSAGSSDGMYYKASKKNGINKTYGAPVHARNKNYGVKVEHDNRGRVRQVGNVFINYDSRDRIKRVGSVYMTYNRYALERVGGLEIIYNRHGQIVDTYGAVKGDRSYDYNQNSNDNDQYYYRTNGSKAKFEHAKVSGNTAIVINRR